MNIFPYHIQIKNFKNLGILIISCFIFSLSANAQLLYDFENDHVSQKKFDSIQKILEDKNVDTYFDALQKIDILEADLIKKNNINSLFVLYYYLTNYHLVNKNASVSKKYLDKIWPLLPKLNNKVLYGQYYEGLGIYYSLQNDTIQKRKYFYLSYNYLSKYGSSSQQADMYYNLSMLNCEEKKWDRVIFFGKKADSITTNVQKRKTAILLLLFVTEAYLNKKDLKNAAYYLKRADIIESDRSNEATLRKYKIKSVYYRVNGIYYELLGNLEKANENYKLGLYYYKLLNLDLAKELNEKLQLESSATINQLLLQKKLKESILENENYRYQKIIIVLGFLIIISLLIIVFLQNKRSKFKTKSNQLLSRKNKELVEAIYVKNRFFNSITHELRTPLNAINGSLYLLKEKHAKEDQETFEILDNSTAYLLKISNQIIEYNLISGENSTIFKLDEINLKSIIENLSKSFNSFNNNQNKITLFFDPNITPFLVFDEVKITMVLNNIVDNAMKFSENSEVKISLNLIEDSSNFQKIKFTIEDTGIGISEENLTKIFDLFYQGSEEIAITYGGSGIGLAIAKKILDLYESKITITSQLNKGTNVEFELNFEKSISNKLEKVKMDRLLPIDNKIKILLVEDNKVNQLLTKKILSNNGYECDIAENGFIAVEKVKEYDYSLILMDIMMPVMDGFEAAKIISELKPTIPIVALTAISENINKEKFEQAKIVKVLNKPLNIKELMTIILSNTF